MTDQAEQSQPQPPHAPQPEPARRGGPLAGVLAAVRETVLVVGAALVLSLLVKTFLVQAFFIPSESMEETLMIGDRVLVSQLTPGPFDLARGDVVVFRDPGGWLEPVPEPERGPVAAAVASALTFVGVLPQDSGEHLVKRVIGLPGDVVECCDDSGRMTVNGVPLEEPYVYPGDAASDLEFSVTVPEGRLWVQGDHRSRSKDSRYNEDSPGGDTVPVDSVVGRAVLGVWPLSRLGWISDHEEVFEDVPDAAPAPAAP